MDNDFETKLENSKKILEILMNPEITLEESVQAYENGMKELQEAQKILENAQLKIQEIRSEQ
jgi:exodeoxyribonuclease VII small subunit